MPKKIKEKEITFVDEGGALSSFFKMFSSDKEEYDFKGLSELRRLLSNERSRLVHTIKTKSPSSIYGLAKLLNRDFKSVFDDVKLLERFGVLDLVSEKKGKRTSLRPVMITDSLKLVIKL